MRKHAWWIVLGLSLVVTRPAFAESTQQGSEITVRGMLKTRSVTREGERQKEYFIAVGGENYVLVGPEAVLAALQSRVREWIDARGMQEVSEDGKQVSIQEAEAITVQQPQKLMGVVEVATVEKKDVISLRSGEHTFRVSEASDVRKLKGFAGKNVELVAQISADDEQEFLEDVEDVERKVLPGEREPRNEKEAFAGAWKGILDVQKLPSGTGGAREGEYPFEFEVDKGIRSASGKVMGQYPVTGAKIRKYRAKTRSIEFEILYTFPGGSSYTISLSGEFSNDWRKIEGSWSSSFLGSGDFKIAYEQLPPDAGQEKGGF